MARSDADIARLEEAAQKWVGTPWCDNSAVVGRGVCCHLLMREVYREAKWLPGLEVPMGSAQAARWANGSPILAWMRGPGSQWFAEIHEDELMPGDTILLRCGHVPHHMGLVLTGDRVLHVTASQGVQAVPAIRVWRRLLAHTFRPR